MATLVVLAALLPRVENPWPETIGLGFPLSTAGAGGVLAGVLFNEADPRRRDRATRLGAFTGFWLGAVAYGSHQRLR
jgi:hypothetical protein